MSGSGLIVWTPVVVNDLRASLHQAGLGTAALIPVESGTVIVPLDRTGVSLAAQWAYQVRKKFAESGVVLAWEEGATIVWIVSGAVALGWGWGGDRATARLVTRLGEYGPIGKAGMAVASGLATSKAHPQKQARAVRRISSAFGADGTEVLQLVQRHDERLPADQLMERVGKPDVAEVVRKCDLGKYEQLRTGWSFQAQRRRASVVIVIVGILVLLGAYWLYGFTGAVIALVGVALSPAIFMWWIRRRNARRPIDELLPVLSLEEPRTT